MKKELVNSTNQNLINSNSSLSSYLFNLSRGRQATPHSWLYENEDSLATLQRWLPIMESTNNKSPFNAEFNQFDQEQIKKFGPQGAVPPIESSEAMEVIEPLYTPSKYNDPNALKFLFPRAHEFARVAFGHRLRRQRPKSFGHVLDDMRDRDTLVTNSGFPRFSRRQRVRELEVQDAESCEAYDYPAIILFRQYNGKLRPVWMFPMSVNLIEFSFTQGIQEALRKSDNPLIREYVSPWQGYNEVKSILTKHWTNSTTVVGGDTTKMDAHMRPAQIQLVYEIVKWFYQEKYWNDLHRSMMHICEIPLLISQTEQLVGTHGLASGSGWTQLVETVLQMFMAWCAGVHGQGIGDDFYWIANVSAEELVDYMGMFGLPANPEKQSVSNTELTFLQRMNHHFFFSREDKKTLGAYYPTVRALNSMLNPERFHKPKDWNSDMFCLRNYMILENCVDNPNFDEFLKFVVRGHKDMIPFAKKTASELDKIKRSAGQVPGLNPSYNQEKRDKPLSSFVSIQLARTL